MTMTATTTRPPSRQQASGGGLSGALAAEWTKLLALRSTWFCLATALLLAVATCVLTAEAIRHNGGLDTIDVHELASLGAELPQFFLIALAALAFTGEYSTGAIRTTLTAVPRRGTALAAKALVVGTVSAATGFLVGLIALAVTAWYFGDALRVTGTGLLHGLGGTALYLSMFSLFVLGLGAVVRSTAGAVTAAIALLLGLPMVAHIANNKTLLAIVDYTPSPLLQTLSSGVRAPHSPQIAALLIIVWAGVGLGTGYAVLRGRDA